MAQDESGEDREQELEHAAMCSEVLMEEYLETGALQPEISGSGSSPQRTATRCAAM
jgi:hypothetical protein